MRTIFHTHIGVPGELFTPEPREAEHLFRVIRARPGDRVLVMDGLGGRAEAEVAGKDSLRFTAVLPGAGQEIELDLYCAIPKKNRLDALLPQLPGLGVRSLHPLLLEHSVATGENFGRWELQLREGCKQSGNPRIPRLHAPAALDPALDEAVSSGATLYYGSVSPAPESSAEPGRVRAWFVGPEGGFTPEEEEKLRTAGAIPLKLGSWIMRLESAAVAGLAVLGRRLPLLLAAVLLTVSCAGCGKGPSVNRHPLMLRADRCRAEGESALALRFYRKLIHMRPEAPEVRLKLATLCDEVLNDPASALYHYNAYLALAPHSPDAPAVEGYRLMAKAKLLRELTRESLPKPPGDVFDEQLRQIGTLKKENESLRRTLTEMNRQYDLLLKMYNDLRPAARPRTAAVPEPPAPAEELYTVNPGDTLSGIAARQKVPLRDLLHANGLTGSSLLRAGQVLRIPR